MLCGLYTLRQHLKRCVRQWVSPSVVNREVAVAVPGWDEGGWPPGHFSSSILVAGESPAAWVQRLVPLVHAEDVGRSSNIDQLRLAGSRPIVFRWGHVLRRGCQPIPANGSSQTPTERCAQRPHAPIRSATSRTYSPSWTHPRRRSAAQPRSFRFRPCGVPVSSTAYVASRPARPWRRQ